ncbi:hypothetical protein T2_00027 [Ralstonia phage Elie]|uniref:Uncharacterized protein n=2 Tax=Bakolyvirus simangalove TaxID=2846051 RepID=A0A7G5BBQ6_9CAUD|nr:hypothetical protein KE332_gp27 [Ralstonia phage Adzire]YP_010077714.1 hypothetical protein KMC38_gp27 [Ralstonia phage Simangalove]QMV32972.1 hypothetical protein T2_00027 [Ralstonia phage Elie]QMV33684.1 hypothetical protein S3_00040 [Ralstonia phage Sarlave]QMV32344.1 hypothetical protein S1_00027 [Ralstonia phage Adzire]QMV33729.1 hypothetical protein R1_00027 [Ralstonia phage Simangalove]
MLAIVSRLWFYCNALAFLLNFNIMSIKHQLEGSMRESNIKHEAGRFWVCDDGEKYLVMAAGITHSVSESAYTRDADGLSTAIARTDWLAKRESEGVKLKI